jgi:hypothetical protein
LITICGIFGTPRTNNPFFAPLVVMPQDNLQLRSSKVASVPYKAFGTVPIHFFYLLIVHSHNMWHFRYPRTNNPFFVLLVVMPPFNLHHKSSKVAF